MNDLRLGDWMQTFTGRQFWPLDPRAEEVALEDVAHSLAHQCRFAGHCRVFYSVAEHSVRVSRIVSPAAALWGLLHDASEAYLVDLPRPVKRHSAIGEHYCTAEALVQRAVCERFRLPLEEPAEIKNADNVVLMTEARDIMSAPPSPWREIATKPLDEVIVPWSPMEAKETFLRRFYELALEAEDVPSPLRAVPADYWEPLP